MFSPVLLGGTPCLRQDGGTQRLQVSNKYVVPPCVRRRSCRPFRLQQREEAATLASVHKLQFVVCVFVSRLYVSLRESTVTLRDVRCCTWQTKQAADPLDVRSMGAEMFCSDESRSSDGRRATRGSETGRDFIKV